MKNELIIGEKYYLDNVNLDIATYLGIGYSNNVKLLCFRLEKPSNHYGVAPVHGFKGMVVPFSCNPNPQFTKVTKLVTGKDLIKGRKYKTKSGLVVGKFFTHDEKLVHFLVTDDSNKGWSSSYKNDIGEITIAMFNFMEFYETN
jgi:hypothetical protein